MTPRKPIRPAHSRAAHLRSFLMASDPRTRSTARAPASSSFLSQIANEPRLLMVLTGLFWAGNAIVARSVAGEIPPIGLAFWRWTIGALVVLPFAWSHVRRDAKLLLADWPIMLVLSALGISFFNAGLYLAAQSTTALNIVMLQSIVPVLIVIASYIIFRDLVTTRQACGIAISLAGALTLISHGDLAVFTQLELNRGDLWMLAANVSYAIYAVLLRRRPAVHGLSFLFATFVVGAALLLPFYAAESVYSRPMPLNWHTLLAVGYVAVFASAVAYLCFNRSVELLGANTAGLAVHLVPVFGTILAVLLLGEQMHEYHLVGIGLIAAGILLATRSGVAKNNNTT
jgi:drug/metabolite transporter (DMT)-like permease